jgi:glyceraldehyde-3-phosphate dehydrogenase (NADP+)
MPSVTFPRLDQIPDSVRPSPGRYENRVLIGGEIRAWSGPSAEVLSPVCARSPDGSLSRVPVARMPMLDRNESLAALAAARKAWDRGRGAWPTMRVARRIGAMERFASGMAKEREEVVRLTMWEIGKSRKDAETEFDRTLAYVRDTVEALKEQDRTAGRFVMEEGFIGQIRRAPLGVVLCMGPFNYPLNETYTTLVPALIMGNTVISKLPRHGALLHLPLLEAMQSAFPPGVVNIVQGDGPEVVGPLMSSGEIDVLAFIGTSRVANLLKKQHPRPNRLRCITGLEAKNPAVVLPSADLDVAVKECASGALSFNGQRCTALKLVFVHRSVADAFVEKLAAAVEALRAGMPWEPGVALTPLPEDDKPARLRAMVDDALAKGARVINPSGGDVDGTFFSPAVVYPVTPEMTLYHEEQFGPIVPVSVYDDEAEIDHFMRKSPYGQQISLFGTDPKKVASLIDALVNQVCRINLNSQCRRGPDTFPFTGRKDSAEGTLSVTDALRAFSIRSVVSCASNEANKALVGEIVTGRLSSFLSTDFIF